MALLPNSGEVMIRGALCGRGVRIQKSWLRESIQRVDPTRRERIVYDFSQDLQSPQEKLKTMLMKSFEGITKTVIVFLKKPYSIIDKKHWSPQQTLYQAFRIKVPKNYFIVNRVLTTDCWGLGPYKLFFLFVNAACALFLWCQLVVLTLLV